MPFDLSKRRREAEVRRPEILRERQRPRVYHEVRRARLVGYDGREHGNGHVARLTAPDQYHGPVIEDVIPGARFCDARQVFYGRHRGRRPDADPAYGQPVFAQQFSEPGHDLPFLLRDLGRLSLVARAIGVTRMTENPVEREAPFSAQLACDLESIARRGIDARPVVSAVDLQPDVEAPPVAGQRLRGVEIVQDDAQRHAGLDRKSTRLNSSHVEISYA